MLKYFAMEDSGFSKWRDDSW